MDYYKTPADKYFRGHSLRLHQRLTQLAGNFYSNRVHVVKNWNNLPDIAVSVASFKKTLRDLPIGQRV